ncbi:hypothetical protein [Parasphingorhabdus sp. NYA22]
MTQDFEIEVSASRDRSQWFWAATLTVFFAMHAALIIIGASIFVLPIIFFLTGFHFARKSWSVATSLFLAACFMVFVHVIVPLPSQVIAHYRMQTYALHPVGEHSIVSNPIKVKGNVSVEWHDSTVSGKTRFQRGVSCDNFCKTLLYQNDVVTVTMANIEPLSDTELRRGEAGRIITSATYRRRAEVDCQTITHPNRVEFLNRTSWESLRNRCYELSKKVSNSDYLIRHGLWSINQPVTAHGQPIDLRAAREGNEFVAEFEEVRGPSGQLDYRRYCTELYPIAPILFFRQTHYVGEGLGFELKREKVATEWYCGNFEALF